MTDSPLKKKSIIASIFWLIFIPPASVSQGKSPLEYFASYFPQINFKRLVPMDLLRILLQVLWLILIKTPQARQQNSAKSKALKGKSYFLTHIIISKFDDFILNFTKRWKKNYLIDQKMWDTPVVYFIALGFSVTFVVLSIMTPFDLSSQLLFAFLLWSIAFTIRRIPGQLITTVLVVFSFTASSRYLWWRVSSTLNWNDATDLTLGLCLLMAEVYVWFALLLGFFQAAWPLERKSVDLPDDTDEWPTVDIFIPTYNEPLNVVKPTVYAALDIDWPKDKVKIYVLDDGCREEFREFTELAGANYLERKDSSHAKAGNLNLALTKTDGEFITILDCDHIPTRSFLQTTMGLFLKKEELAVVQTPHHFFSADPFERNLGTYEKIPNENELFYALIQDGNDLWNATFFCGSCAVIKRKPLEEIGGIAVETVTEDAHTALRLHRLGYSSAFLKLKQAAGLATESFSGHIGQRIRWARGMTQIFRIDNPMLGKGLKLRQRLCYINAMLHFLNGVPRLIFLTAPLAFLLFKTYIVYASSYSLFLYVLPHLLLTIMTNSRVQGKYRFTFWSEVYEAALAWHIAKPTTVALLDPNKGHFNVTEKGGLVKEEYFDWSVSKSYLLLVFLNILGFCFGINYIINDDPQMIQTVLVTMFWATYNILILGTVVAVTTETKQQREAHRIRCDFPVTIFSPKGHCYHAKAVDFSEGGLGIKVSNTSFFAFGDKLKVSLKQNNREYIFPIVITFVGRGFLGVNFANLTPKQENDLIRCTFSRADIWEESYRKEMVDRPLHNIGNIFLISLKGYGLLVKHFILRFNLINRMSHYAWDYILWLIPRNINNKKSS